MSKIDKLSILGVRSFDNVRSEVIQFHAPLTLIVGMNGSGKTTIIECLKYATTGEMPPNAKVGGAFIHDPKLCGEKEVLAQVKLSFKSTEGTKMVCTRNLQLTVKKTARSMKTLEGSLAMSREGERVTMSSRVAEMDTMMPQYLGVSKAVLDSVIFCHQEESLWPLSEPAKLKERFDKIFEALKYTKAIDNIKVLQKKKREDLAGFKKDEEHTKLIKAKAEQNQKRSTELSDDLDKMRSEADELSVRIADAASKAEQYWEQANAAGKIVGELEGKRHRAEAKEESVQNLRKNLTEMTDSDDDLQRMLNDYEKRVQHYEDDLESQKKRYGDLNTELQNARDRVTAKERECGSYEAQQESYERQVENRERLVKDTARSHNIRGFNMEIDDAQVQAFMDHVGKLARDQNAALERAKRETQDELRRAQKVLNDINQQKSALNQRKENARQTISKNDHKIGTLQDSLNKINVDEGGKATMELHLRETELKLESAKSQITNANWDSGIEKDEATIRQFEDRREKLNAELVEGTLQAGDSARLDFVQKELKDRQKGLETMTGAHTDKISSVVGQGWKPASIELEFQRTLEQSASQVAEAERQRDGTTREMEQLEFKLNSSRTELKVKRNALKAAETAIRDAMQIEPEDYPDSVRSIEHSRDIAKSDAESFAKVLEYFDSCIKSAKDHGGCRTCARPFKNSQELDKMLKTVEKEKKKLEGGEDLTNDLKEIEEALKEARDVSSDYDTWKKTKDEIPSVEQAESTLTKKREQLLRQLEDQDAVVSARQAAKRDIEAMSKTIQNIAKYHIEILEFEAQIRELTAKQKTGGLSRGLETIQDDIKKVNDETKVIRNRLTKTMNDRERSKSSINSLELERRDIKSKLSTAEYELKEKKSLENQIEEYKGLNDEQRETVKSVDQELQSLVPQLSQAQISYDDIATRGEEGARELQDGANKINSSLNDLRKADQEVKAYIAKGGPQQLARGKREAQALKDEVGRVEQEQGQIVRKVKDLETQLHDHSDTKKSISENQIYRRDLRQLQVLYGEITELESHNAEEDKEYHEREGHKWQMERSRLAGRQSELAGEMRAKDHQLEQHINDWETDYKHAARKYKEAHIQVETTKACVEDLGRYGGALDKAIMKYHSLKMEEINRYIAELWRETYQGTDVDTIMIRSESENVKSNKSYNYHVVMVKQDAEMDMRGRCSAGQKVLASIIIRLALAECFGLNCGMLALDEPTTNLDRDNIQALAESLNKIIQNRRKQSNFQLIIITHDEHFLRQMRCSDFADVYWRVSRNERQKSVIERQNISDVI